MRLYQKGHRTVNFKFIHYSLMGACNCVGEKKENGSVDVVDKSSPSKKQQEESAPVFNQEISLDLKISQKPLGVVKIQSVVRGYMTRKIYLSQSQYCTNDQIINEYKTNDLSEQLVSQEASQMLIQLGPWAFEKTQTPGVTWRGPTKLADGGIYEGE